MCKSKQLLWAKIGVAFAKCTFGFANEIKMNWMFRSHHMFMDHGQYGFSVVQREPEVRRSYMLTEASFHICDRFHIFSAEFTCYTCALCFHLRSLITVNND